MTEYSNNITQPVGLLRLGRIVSYNLATGKAQIKLGNISETITDGPNIEISIPNGIYSEDGIFVGSLAKKDTSVAVMRGEGGKWYFVAFLITNPTKIPNLTPGQLLIQSSDLSKITLDTKNNINIGSDTDRLHLFVNKNDLNNSLLSSTFDNTFSFTEASRQINGVIKREVKQLSNFSSSIKLKSDDFYERLYPISLDPTVTSSNSFLGQVKNPPFVEKRELVYEFAYSHDIKDDLNEARLYENSGKISNDSTLNSNYTNRRQSRSDTLSLSLVAPNYLMETVKGTVVDIFGNILDLNRNPIPIGTKNLTFKLDDGINIKSDVFNAIKEAERKGIAFHFELNARKDLKQNNSDTVVNLLDINSTADYARNRSRFFFDIDKEGQFKLNIPASSKTGNVSLLTRYENYSTFGTEENGNPDKLVYRQDNLDIFSDSFSTQDIEIKSSDAAATPIDRITNEHIKKGMPYHSIADSIITFQSVGSSFLDFQYNTAVNLTGLPTINNVVSPTIFIDGPQANAGGRSGSINLDGSLELSIGANTVDRQSLWLDTAGGILANVGRDKNNVSAGLSFDGDLLIQVGGYGVAGDTRFNKFNNSYRGGAFDIRVLNDGFTVSIIRIDKTGVTIATPNTVTLKGRDIIINAEGNLILEGDNVSINERSVLKFPVTSI